MIDYTYIEHKEKIQHLNPIFIHQVKKPLANTFQFGDQLCFKLCDSHENLYFSVIKNKKKVVGQNNPVFFEILNENLLEDQIPSVLVKIIGKSQDPSLKREMFVSYVEHGKKGCRKIGVI